MENLMIDNFSIVNIKFVNHPSHRKFHIDYMKKFKFFVPGYVIKDEEGRVIEKGTKMTYNIEEESLYGVFDRYFDIANNSDTLTKTKEIQQFTKTILDILKKQKMNIEASSILILFNRKTRNLKMSLIDMNHFTFGFNQNIAQSVQSLIYFFKCYEKRLNLRSQS